MSEQWFVARTHLAKETFARSALLAEGLDVYLPLYASHWDRLRAESQGTEPRIRPFLPSYLFFRADLADENGKWRAVFSSPGVHSVLCTANGRPEAIPDWVIEDIQEREIHGLVQLPPPTMSQREWRRLNAKFKEGEVVTIKGSPMEAIFVEMVDKQRAAVFVTLLGKVHRKNVLLSHLS